MRKSLYDFFGNAIIMQYTLPAETPAGKIPRAIISTRNDDCLNQLVSNDEISKLIYNGIVEYAYNDYEIDLRNLDNLQLRALQNKLKYNPAAPISNQIGYGFHAEVLLHLILDYFYHAQKCIARGYLYSPLANSETKGYDSYMMVEDDNGCIYLLFGEAKAYINGFKQSVDMIFDNIKKVLSDEYLNRNFLEMEDKIEKINPNSRIPQIIEAWRANPLVNMAVEAQNYKMELVYPMFIMYDDKAPTYDERILKIVNYINTICPTVASTLTLQHTLFFIFLPVNDCRAIKYKVVEWISQQQPLMP